MSCQNDVAKRESTIYGWVFQSPPKTVSRNKWLQNIRFEESLWRPMFYYHHCCHWAKKKKEYSCTLISLSRLYLEEAIEKYWKECYSVDLKQIWSEGLNWFRFIVKLLCLIWKVGQRMCRIRKTFRFSETIWSNLQNCWKYDESKLWRNRFLQPENFNIEIYPKFNLGTLLSSL